MLRIFTIVFLLAFTPVSAFSFRCNNKIVTKGMVKAEVIERCGFPMYMEDTGVSWMGNTMFVNSTWVMEAEKGHFRRIIFWSGNKMIEVRLGSRRK